MCSDMRAGDLFRDCMYRRYKFWPLRHWWAISGVGCTMHQSRLRPILFSCAALSRNLALYLRTAWWKEIWVNRRGMIWNRWTSRYVYNVLFVLWKYTHRGFVWFSWAFVITMIIAVWHCFHHIIAFDCYCYHYYILFTSRYCLLVV